MSSSAKGRSPAVKLASETRRSNARQLLVGVAVGSGVSTGSAYLAAAPDFGLNSLQGITTQSLFDAIELSAKELDQLMLRADVLGKELFEFQAEMLRDPALAELALLRIDRGEPVALAWAMAMDDYMAAFEGEGDERHMRNMDLVDIRNRVLSALGDTPRPDFPTGSVYVADDIEPSVFLNHDWNLGGGIALREGSTSSHVAMLARAYGVPMVTALGGVEIEAGSPVLVDGMAGTIIVNPDEKVLMQLLETTPMRSKSLSDVTLLATINRLSDLDLLEGTHARGIGLVRTEFLLSTASEYFNEDLQTKIYAEIARRSPGPVWIRLFDLGGDKQVDGLSLPEQFPFLGVRGVRFLLARVQLLKAQARALLRAAVDGKVSVLVPMVTVPEELKTIRNLFEQEVINLQESGTACAMPKLGIMVETPSAALMLGSFDADFFSIGTTDLLQYISAAARGDQTLAQLRTQAIPGLMKLVRICAAEARSMGKPIAACGDLASDIKLMDEFRDAGISTLAIDPAMLAVLSHCGAGNG